MKSRSHNQRIPAMDPPDDWVNGSWTVDCVCGVNFDDGEEMVDCDECGVWVHTRCARYVKSEKSFSCDKCKNRSSGNECEETEVAQMLVELPNKTVRIDNNNINSDNNDNNNHNSYPPPGPSCRPIRLWTHRPMEERVHVQGVPGGEPSLFGGLSSIFTPELWKCTGHVPKKFNFKYKEFPCWDDDQNEDENENENPIDKGAGVLCSLSKDVLATPLVNTLFRKKGKVEGGGCERVGASEDLKKCEEAYMNLKSRQKDIRKEGNLLRPFDLHSGKRKQEVSWVSKGGSVKKKVRLVHKNKDSKKIATETTMTVVASIPRSDGKQSVTHETGISKNVQTDNEFAKSSEPDMVQIGPLSGDEDVVENNVENLACREKPQENNCFKLSRQNLSAGAGPEEEKVAHQVYTRNKDSSNTGNSMTSIVKEDFPVIISSKEEAVGSGIDNVNASERGSPINGEDNPKKSVALIGNFISEVTDGEGCPEKSSDHKVKSILNIDHFANVESSSVNDAKIEGTKSPDNLDIKIDNVTMASLKTTGLKAQDNDTDSAEKSPSNLSHPIRQVLRSEHASSAERNSTDIKLNTRVNNSQPSKISTKNTIPQAPSSKPKVTENQRASDSKSHNSKTGISDSNNNLKKDKDRQEKSDNNVKKDRGSHEEPRKISKEHSKSSLGSMIKASLSGKVSQASEAKRNLSDLKNSAGGSSSKTASNQNNGVISGSEEPASSLENQNLSNVCKISSLGSSLRGEKSNNSASNLAPNLPASSNSPAILSDEELALLLHQELNSSPRVPRVPRVRNAGSVPQLGSPTGTTMLIKRTSSSSGRDQSVVGKRKGKDSPKRGSNISRNTDDESRDSFPLSSDQRNNKLSRATDALPKKEGDNTGKSSHNAKKNAIPLSPTIVYSRPFSPSRASETKSGSSRHPLRNQSDDDSGTAKGHVRQTLPELLADIMGEGKRMTYEELCNAVLPHWPHLRKHNGERYAYSTHSQAVLDCLRNRQEWARLVDRGPKQTNGSRKRRKHDTETQSNESEDEEHSKDTSTEEIESGSLKSHREDFPKGKRKARKRRRIPFQGKRVKDVTSRRKIERDDGENNGSVSSRSSEDSIYSDDEINGDNMCRNGSEAGSSSAED